MIAPAKHWFIIREDGSLRASALTPSSIQTMENLWVKSGLTVVKVDGARILLVGSFDWAKQFIEGDL